MYGKNNKEDTMKRCYNCDTILEDDELFCHECGAKQEIEEAEVEMDEQSVEEKFCVHCGKAIDDDSMFCPYCGSRQNEQIAKPEPILEVAPDASSLQDEVTEEHVQENVQGVKEPEDTTATKPSISETETTLSCEENQGSKKWLLIVGVILLLGILGGGGYYFMTNKDGGSSYIVETDSIAEIGDSVNTTDDEAAMMDALAARNNAMEEAFGVLALHKCPQKIDGLSVELAMDDDYGQSVKITKDGKFLQELKGDFYQGSPMVFDNSMVYYVDANFDEYTDIFIGTGDDRTDNTILLWNSDKNLFEKYGKIGEPSLMNPYFSPSENAIYECGQNGFYSFGYSKSVWKDGKLVTQEHLDEIINIDEGFDYKTYNEGLDYKRSKKYALFDSNYKLIMETNEIDELPNKWAEVIRE